MICFFYFLLFGGWAIFGLQGIQEGVLGFVSDCQHQVCHALLRFFCYLLLDLLCFGFFVGEESHFVFGAREFLLDFCRLLFDIFLKVFDESDNILVGAARNTLQKFDHIPFMPLEVIIKVFLFFLTEPILLFKIDNILKLYFLGQRSKELIGSLKGPLIHVLPNKSSLIIQFLPLRVRQYLVGFLNLLKFLTSGLITQIFVRMAHHGLNPVLAFLSYVRSYDFFGSGLGAIFKIEHLVKTKLLLLLFLFLRLVLTLLIHSGLFEWRGFLFSLCRPFLPHFHVIKSNILFDCLVVKGYPPFLANLKGGISGGKIRDDNLMREVVMSDRIRIID